MACADEQVSKGRAERLSLLFCLLIDKTGKEVPEGVRPIVKAEMGDVVMKSATPTVCGGFGKPSPESLLPESRPGLGELFGGEWTVVRE